MLARAASLVAKVSSRVNSFFKLAKKLSIGALGIASKQITELVLRSLAIFCDRRAMQDPQVLDAIRSKYAALLDDLDERRRRRWAAVEARALGRGGITAVASATGLSDRTVRTGLKELDDPGPRRATSGRGAYFARRRGRALPPGYARLRRG